MSLNGVGNIGGGWPVPEDVTRVADGGVADLKRVYRRLARAHHPDRNPDDPEATRRFQGIHDAYVALETGLQASTPRVRTATRAPESSEIVCPDAAPKATAAYAACEDAWRGPAPHTLSFLA
jgi:DnaJ domain